MRCLKQPSIGATNIDAKRFRLTSWQRFMLSDSCATLCHQITRAPEREIAPIATELAQTNLYHYRMGFRHTRPARERTILATCAKGLEKFTLKLTTKPTPQPSARPVNDRRNQEPSRMSDLREHWSV